MEVLIAGAIVLAGYVAADPGREPRVDRRPRYAPPLKHPKEHPRVPPAHDQPTRQFDDEHRELAARRWAESTAPGVTGTFAPQMGTRGSGLPPRGPPGAPLPPNTTPFFRSAKSQNTNDVVKQTRLELFTGANTLGNSATGTYRHKREVETMFSPAYTAQAVTSSGSSGNAVVERDKTRYEASATHRNVLPFEQIRVGRGVGVGPDVPAADGFHPMYRVMPKNVNEHRKNNLPGGFVVGGSAISKRTADVRLTVNPTKSKSTTLVKRPVLPTAAAVKAHRVYPIEHAARGRPVYEEDRYGAPTAKGTYVGPACDSLVETKLGYEFRRDHHDRNHTLPVINAGAAGSGVGAFTYATFDTHCSTQREQAGHSGFVTGPKARVSPSAHVMPPTQRQTLDAMPVGGIGRICDGGALRPGDVIKATHRQAINQVEAPLTGTRAAVLGGTLDNVWRYNKLMRQAKRGDRLVSHTPGPQGINVIDPDSIGAVALRPHGPQAVGMGLPDVPNKPYATTVGRRTTPSNKLPTLNPRLNLGIAAAQLRNNPFAMTLAG